MGSRRRCCCSGTAAPIACCPCDIPASDLTVTYASTGAAGNGSMTLTYIPAAGPVVAEWRGSCLDLGIVTLGVIGPRHCWMSFRVFCSGGTTTWQCVTWYLTTDTGCLWTSGSAGGTHQNLGIDSFTCAPFHFHHNVDGRDSFPASVLQEAGFTSMDLDSSQSTSGTCQYLFNVQEDCNFFQVEGATVNLWTSAAKTTFLGAATTDSSGNCTITSTSRVATPYFEVTGARFVTVASTRAGPSPSPRFVTITPAAGYHCSLCAWPEPATMHVTHPVFGAVTLTWDSGTNHWITSISYSYPGNVAGGGTCTAKTVTIHCDWDGSGTYYDSWTADVSGCPDDAGAGGTQFAFWSYDSNSCYVPSVSSLLVTFLYTPPGGSPQENLYGVGSLSLGVAE